MVPPWDTPLSAGARRANPVSVGARSGPSSDPTGGRAWLHRAHLPPQPAGCAAPFLRHGAGAAAVAARAADPDRLRSEEHTSELQSLMRNSYAVFFLKKKTQQIDY